MFNSMIFLLFAELINSLNFKSPVIGSLSISGNRILPFRKSIPNSKISFGNQDSIQSHRTALKSHSDDYTSIHNIKKLVDSRPIQFPMEIIVNQYKYLIENKIVNDETVVYEGIAMDTPRQKLIFKVFLNGKSSDAVERFKNEKIALSELKRLVDFDNQNLIIISQKINGITLEQKLQQLANHKTLQEKFLLIDLIQKYSSLPRDLRNNHGLVHYNISPQNVIVDDNNDLHLIDFSKTVPLSGDRTFDMLEGFMDDFIAYNFLGFDLLMNHIHPVDGSHKEWN